jgi:erythronate-4-phosphate dehydrogenase
VIVADDAIAAVEEAFGDLGELRTLPGRAIDRAVLADADALLVRTVTRVDPALVAGTPVRFVGSATAGVDHVDRPGLHALGIEVAHAPGCNATAVAEVVLAALATLAARGVGSFPPSGPVGIVGFGAIGRRLAVRLRRLGTEVIACDPPLSQSRAAKDEIDHELAALVQREPFVPLPELLAASAVVTLHMPLVGTGPFPTRHLLDAAGLRHLSPGAIVINTSRGGVLDDDALLAWLSAGRGTAILDVWEEEPAPPKALVDRVALATPHVAGYSLEGKLEATRRIHVALARALGRAPSFDPAHHVPAAPPDLAADRPCTLASALATAIDVASEDAALRHALAEAGADRTRRAVAFERLRREHPLRRELSAFTVATSCSPSVRDSLHQLGVHVAAD